MIVIAAPAAAEDGITIQRVSHTDARLIICTSRRKSAERNGRVPAMPQEAAVIRSFAGRVVFRIIEHRETEPEPVTPWCKMSDPNSKLQAQSSRHFPGILQKALVC